MKLFVGALVTVAIGWGVVLASPAPARRAPRDKAEQRARAAHACRARGANCKLVEKAGVAPDRGAPCICD